LEWLKSIRMIYLIFIRIGVSEFIVDCGVSGRIMDRLDGKFAIAGMYPHILVVVVRLDVMPCSVCASRFQKIFGPRC
jgi:hypothetical protein